ncbi:MAG TPA: hypothetical protein QGH10_01285 [Armatimonadota bacterium]|nr:hypothetical protein [Armatimonadota bacterium]
MSLLKGRVWPLILCVAIIIVAPQFVGCSKDEVADPEVDAGLVIAAEPTDLPPEATDNGVVEDPADPADEPTDSAPESPEEPDTEEEPAVEPDIEPEPRDEVPETGPELTPSSDIDPRDLVVDPEPELTPPTDPVEPAMPTVPDPEPEKPEGTVVIGTVTVASAVPDPGTVPYKECLTVVKYKVDSVESGDYDGGEVLAVLWGMKENKLKDAASFSPGQKHRLKIQPFSERKDLARIMQADDTNDYSSVQQWVVSYSSP